MSLVRLSALLTRSLAHTTLFSYLTNSPLYLLFRTISFLSWIPSLLWIAFRSVFACLGVDWCVKRTMSQGLYIFLRLGVITFFPCCGLFSFEYGMTDGIWFGQDRAKSEEYT